MPDAFRMDVDLTGAIGALSRAGYDWSDVARASAQAGAQVFVDQARANLAGIGVVTWNLRDSIYQAWATHKASPLHPVYEVSWNPRTAPHAHLIEYGHRSPFAQYLGKDGEFHTAVRRFPKGKKPPRPKWNASLAEKSAYYMPRADGSLDVPAKPFMRPAWGQAKARAMQAMKERFAQAWRERMEGAA